MSISISQLRERVAEQFKNVEQVDESIIRYTRKMGDLPFAVYYLDVAGDLPGTSEKLTKYQDRVIGSHYFEGEKSLQWSNYLYFITDRKHLESSQVRQAKELIERDRSYARKFVIAEEELDSVLTPSVVGPREAFPRTNILSMWVERLVEAGLDTAIFSSDDLPRRLAVIESSSSQPATEWKLPGRSVQVKPAPFIRSLHLKTFRNFPVRRIFEFGAVNLIFGANGSGKTSLLEAIELFYCGRNKRNPAPLGNYELIATLADGEDEKAITGRDLQLFRDRNLNWYGQSEVKTNNLYQSFAQFNFLDTDAAVHLAESSSTRIEDDLSKLLVGPDASKTWRDIERVNEALDAKLKDLRPLETQLNDELLALDNRLKEASGLQQESDLIRIRLEEMIKRLGWSGGQDGKEAFAGKLVEALSELVSLARQAAELDWTETPVSIDGLTKYCREAKVISEKAEGDIARLEVVRKNQKRLADAIERDQKAADLANQAKRLIDAGVPNRAAERGKQQSAVATYSGWLAGLNADFLSVLSPADLGMTVEACQKAAASKRSAAQESLATSKAEHSNFSKLHEQSVNLAQELRQVAARILQNNSKPDECPLCHTQFGPGELAKHMKVGVDEHVEAVGQTLLNQIATQEAAVRDATAGAAASDWLKKFSERANLSAGVSVRSALAGVEDAKRTLAEARGRLETLNKEVASLESQGLSVAQLEKISAGLRELGYPLSEVSLDAADRLLLTITEDSTNSSQTIEAGRTEAANLEQSLATILGSAESGIQVLKSAFARVREKLATTESILAKLRMFSSSFAWSGGKSVAALAVEADSVRKVAVELQAALGREKQAQASHAESIKRRESLDGELKKLRPRIKRLTQAHAALDGLKREYPLEKAMDAALQQNRAAVESIFSHIHSPAEFRGLGPTWTILVRRESGREAKLTEISTGQRAAFALSIFLAQNAQLTVAPPVVLIDDPIAHVDDLNSLSFLDYLRELVLTGRRQIYFATANEKLATLFERKFDFLGSERFRRFDLWRET
jgi:exonuclease SbcC